MLAKDSLQKVLKPLDMRYSQYINKQQKTTGTLWQGRFFYHPLDDQYTYYAFAYVENNTVEAGMTEQAIEYQYSIEKHHERLCVDKLITDY